jgi:hypothetical protein
LYVCRTCVYEYFIPPFNGEMIVDGLGLMANSQ